MFADSPHATRLVSVCNLSESGIMTTRLSRLLNELNHQELSTRQIEAAAEKAGHSLSYATASRYMKGTHPATPSAEVLRALAAVFRVDVNRLREAAGQPPEMTRFELPSEADVLSAEERQAIINLVRVMAREKQDRTHDYQPQGSPPDATEP